MSKNILLIGGAGYIGPVVTSHLLDIGYKVTCLDVLLYNNGQSIIQFLSNPNYSFVNGDLTDEAALLKSLSGVSDVVVLAGLVGDPITKKYPDVAEKINSIGIINCFKTLSGKGLNRLVFVSTCSNYGLIMNNELADEEFELSPLSSYAKSKVEAEKFLMSKKNNFDYTPTILRFATAFGLSTRMRFDLTVNEFTREMLLRKKLNVFDADTWRPYCHVQDFARLIAMILEANSDKVAYEVFNAGGQENNFTKRMIVEVLMEKIPDSVVEYNQHGGDPRNYRVNFSKVKSVIGFEPSYSIVNGIDEITDALKNNLFPNVESNLNYFGNYNISYII
jgi:nucleoside-diphosphate-sugar epimerase